jgi:hypothetical protein
MSNVALVYSVAVVVTNYPVVLAEDISLPEVLVRNFIDWIF